MNKFLSLLSILIISCLLVPVAYSSLPSYNKTSFSTSTISAEPVNFLNKNISELQQKINKKRELYNSDTLSSVDQAYQEYQQRHVQENESIKNEIEALIANGGQENAIPSPEKQAYQNYQKEHMRENDNIRSEIENLIQNQLN